MPVVYHCPQCGQAVTVADNLLGRVVGCPHCRTHFQTFPLQPAAPAPPPPPSPPPPPGPAQVFALDDVDDDASSSRRGGSRSNGRAGSRYGRQEQALPLPNLLALIAAIIGSVIVMLVNQNNRKAGQGFDVKEVAISGAVGGVCAGLGYLLGVLIQGNSGGSGPRRSYSRGRDRDREDDEDDDDRNDRRRRGRRRRDDDDDDDDDDYDD